MQGLFTAMLVIAMLAGPVAAVVWMVCLIPAIGSTRQVAKARAKLVTLGSFGVFFVGCVGVATTNTVGQQQEAADRAKRAEERSAARPPRAQTTYEWALARGSKGGFTAALKDLHSIPKGDPDYAKAQVKIREYKAKEAQVRKAEAAKVLAAKKSAEAKASAAALAKAEAAAARLIYSSLGPNEYITNDGYLAALTEDLLDKVTEYSINGDSEALARLVDSGAVIMLKPGLRVFRVDSGGFLGSKIKIRPRGQNLEIWTVMEAVSNGQ